MRRILDIVIIGEDGFLRNKDLGGELAPYSPTYTDPVKVEDTRTHVSEFAQKANTRILGRQLLRGEVGCSLAHEKARGLISTPWGLILEDDAVITKEMIATIHELLRNCELDYSSPTIISLIDKTDIKSNQLELERLHYLPSGTAAYICSKTVANLDRTTSSMIGTADWPFSMADVHFYLLRGIGVTEYPAMSGIDAPNEKRHHSGALFHYLRVCFNLGPLVVQLGPRSVFYAFFSPIKRDLRNRWLKAAAARRSD